MDMLTILYVNSINCLPILVIIMVSIGEYSRLLTYDGWDDPTLYGSISALLVVGGGWHAACRGCRTAARVVADRMMWVCACEYPVCNDTGLLNYAMFLCTVVNSAVLTTVVGVIKVSRQCMVLFLMPAFVNHLTARFVVRARRCSPLSLASTRSEDSL